jgi:hypothetical protein
LTATPRFSKKGPLGFAYKNKKVDLMILLLAALALSADPAVPQPPAAPQAVPAKPGKEKKICKVDTSDSTSRLRKRTCLTQTEWDQKEAGKEVNDLKNVGAR